MPTAPPETVAMPAVRKARTRHRLRAGMVAVVAAAGVGSGPTLAAEPNATGAAPDRSKHMVQTSGKTASRTPPGVSADELVTLFPPRLGDWTQTELGKTPPRRREGPAPLVVAEYTSGAHTATIRVASGLLPAAVASGQRQLSRTAGASAGKAVTVSLANGVQITASSLSADDAALEGLLQSIDLARAEALRPAGK